MKNRNREPYSFANINLLGVCNAYCFFCLGKDIPHELNKHNQLNTHFSEWINFKSFLEQCKSENVSKLFITGQNTDSLCYKYLTHLVLFLKEMDFEVGLRTNGYLAEQKREAIELCNGEIGYSVHSLICKSNEFIMGRRDLLDLSVLDIGKNVRVSIVVNRYNVGEFEHLVKVISERENVRYIQARRVSTDTRLNELELDIKLYDLLLNDISKKYKHIGDINLAPKFEMFGKEVCFWKTIETSVNSLNYFTDGTCSDEYFVVEGYLKNYKNLNPNRKHN